MLGNHAAVLIGGIDDLGQVADDRANVIVGNDHTLIQSHEESPVGGFLAVQAVRFFELLGVFPQLVANADLSASEGAAQKADLFGGDGEGNGSAVYEKAQKWNNQLLHHTPAGMPVWLNPDEPLKVIAAPNPSVPAVVFPAYWSYGQLVYLVLEVVPNQDWRPFEPVFLRGLAEGFGAPIPESAYS